MEYKGVAPCPICNKPLIPHITRLKITILGLYYIPTIIDAPCKLCPDHGFVRYSDLASTIRARKITDSNDHLWEEVLNNWSIIKTQ